MSDWKDTLRELLEAVPGEGQRLPEGPSRVRGFISHVVVPAFEEIAEEVREYGRDVEVEFAERNATLRLFHEGKEEFCYEVRIRAHQRKKFAFPVIPLRDAEGRTFRAEIHLRDGPLHLDVTNATKEELIRYFLRDYARRLRWTS